MKINKKLELALNAVSVMEHEKTYTIESIAQALSASTHFLEQIFRKLRMAGIVKSVRGPGGGYRRVGPTNALAVAQAVESLGEQPTSGKASETFSSLRQALESVSV